MAGKVVSEKKGAIIDYQYIIMCVPDNPSDDFYNQVGGQWEMEVRSEYEATERSKRDK